MVFSEDEVNNFNKVIEVWVTVCDMEGVGLRSTTIFSGGSKYFKTGGRSPGTVYRYRPLNSVYKYRLRKNPTKARKRSSFLYGNVNGRYMYPKKTARKHLKKGHIQNKELVIPPGHFLSVRNCQNTLVSANLEDE
uniref:Uncharacterized protein LOC111108039 n=1 Tax=Crassostrea virginica TaxID=6565 RepID=A0A8B8B746_CRAVI|nr:uncharacterized protein LOC111108039 [Crassostrea virginica]